MNRHARSGATMGTRWSALFRAPRDFDPYPVDAALQEAVDEVDRQMSTWKPDSDLMRINAAPVNSWIEAPARLLEVLRLGLAIGAASGGAFDVGLGDAVAAWGFGPAAADPRAIREALAAKRQPAHEVLEIDGARVRKRAPIWLDLNGIAKGYAVDRLAETLADRGIVAGLVGLDGELRAMGRRSDGKPWAIAIEEPDADRRAAHSVLELEDAAVATSGDYRHFIETGGRRFSHTMDPMRGAPLGRSPASVTVVARTCAEADAMATALMVLGLEQGKVFAEERGLHALFIARSDDNGLIQHPVGTLFRGRAAPQASAAVPQIAGVCTPGLSMDGTNSSNSPWRVERHQPVSGELSLPEP